MLSYLPNAHELSGVAGLAATLLLFLALGSAATPRRTLPEFQFTAGWGVACLVLTAWGVLTPWSLRWPAAALGLAAVAWLARPGWRERLGAWAALMRMLALTAPFWLLMLSVWPSQIDTWLNLLPNAAYLFDHDRLPTASLPPSYSFLPVAPYNTQFADYLASLASGGFADGAMGLFNAALLCAAALLLARALAATAEGTPPWWACAVGLLLVGPLNPGFVPRFFISPYGEAPLAVTALFAVWLAAEFLGDLARGIAWPKVACASGTGAGGAGQYQAVRDRPPGTDRRHHAGAGTRGSGHHRAPRASRNRGRAGPLAGALSALARLRAEQRLRRGRTEALGVRRLELRTVAADHPRPVGGDVTGRPRSSCSWRRCWGWRHGGCGAIPGAWKVGCWA